MSWKTLLRYLAWYLIILALSAVLIMVGAWAIRMFLSWYSYHYALLVSYILTLTLLAGTFFMGTSVGGRGLPRYFNRIRATGGPDIVEGAVKEDEQEKDSSWISVVAGMVALTLVVPFFFIL